MFRRRPRCQGRSARPLTEATTAAVHCSSFLTQNTPTEKLTENTHHGVKSTLSNSNKGGGRKTSNPVAANIFSYKITQGRGTTAALGPATKHTLASCSLTFQFMVFPYISPGPSHS